MLEQLLPNGKKAFPPGIYSKVRLVLLTSARGQVGVQELRIFDNTGKNLCRETDYVPTIIYSPGSDPGTMASYPPSNTIDGDISSWTSSCYILSKTDGTYFLEYTFPHAINIVAWELKAESSWVPGTAGAKLMVLKDNVWIDLNSTTADPAWTQNELKRFTVVP